MLHLSMNLPFFSEYYLKSPVTCIISFLVLITTATALLNKKLFFHFILHPFTVVRNKQLYRIFTADLTNADYMHLLLNEFMLYVFCSDLEEALRVKSPSGSWYFVLIYFGSLLVASTIVIIRHFRDFNYSSTGTSGSIMGSMFAFMVIAPKHVVYHIPGIGGVENIYGGLAYIIMLVIYQRRRKEETVNHEFHFYGALAGAVIGFALWPLL